MADIIEYCHICLQSFYVLWIWYLENLYLSVFPEEAFESAKLLEWIFCFWLKKKAIAMKTFPSGGSESCFRGNLYCLLSFLVAISFSQLEHFVKTSLQQSYCWVSFYTSYLAGMTRHSTVGFACSWFSIHLTF